ncbi:MAG: hypothetical protein WC975_14930 [Phycisphaerae bacterium]
MSVKIGFSGITIGGSGGLGSLKLVFLSIFIIALAILTLSDFERGQRNYNLNLDKLVPFKCINCNTVVLYKIRDLQKLQTPNDIGFIMGPVILDCPYCRTKNLTQAVECPRCKEIFIIKMDTMRGFFDDRCTMCGESYSKAWQEKYRSMQND